MAVFVESQIADAQFGFGCRRDRRCAANQTSQAGHNFFQAEWFGHVVIAASRQACHAIFHGVLRGQEQHRNIGLGVAQSGEDIETRHIGEHHVEDNRIGPKLAGRA